MSRFVIHPVWPVTSPRHIEYALFRVTPEGEHEVSRSHSLDQLERLLRRIRQHRPH